jgi:hypothetical protein
MREKLILFIAKKLAVIIIKWRGNRFHYVKAIKRAEELAAGTRKMKGKRTYVYFIGGKYRALNRKQIQYWRNHTKGVRQGLKVSEMTGIQLYDTELHVNSHKTYPAIEIPGINIQYIRSKDLSCTSNNPK